MKTARFSKVVEECGEPETYLLLMDPAKDRTFQAALKAQKVMTVFQETVGTKTDRGEVGFHAGRGREFLIFPKSLKTFAGRSVVGIKYDHLKSPEVSERERAKPSPQPKKKFERVKAPRPKAARAENVVAFKRTLENESPDEAAGEIAELKRKVRHAMKVLEEGKAVAAFNLLKRIVG